MHDVENIELESKAGQFKSIRKSKYPSVIYWIVFYTYTFLVATKYFIYEDAYVSTSFAFTSLYQHVAIIASIIVGCFIYRKKVSLPKKIYSVIVTLLIMFAAIFSEVRTNTIYSIVLAIILGQLASCSLSTYIYEMNNAERLFGIVLCHILSAVVGILNVWLIREESAFYWIIFGLAIIASVCCYLEKNRGDEQVCVMEEFQSKLYLPVGLACVGGIVSVGSAMLMVLKFSQTDSYMRLYYYGGALIGALIYFLIYKFYRKPASASLQLGFGLSVISIVFYFVVHKATMIIASIFAGMTFIICMMNLYYILCNIIKKYRGSHIYIVAPASANLVGGLIAINAFLVSWYGNDLIVRVELLIFLIGNVFILITTNLWQKGLSLTAKEEQYFQSDTTITKDQVYDVIGLSDREKEVADLLIEGLPLKNIAAKLYISENTAKTHRSVVYRKACVSNREEFIAKIGIEETKE